mmetsp:Transcript_26524/g.87950  ORF Transcript_26524/g.87950 Transcript_26524/m.87950 type:complete len:269 (-) Transcript_26524:81-887(-)
MGDFAAMLATASPEMKAMLAEAQGSIRVPERRHRMNSIDSCSSEEAEEEAPPRDQLPDAPTVMPAAVAPTPPAATSALAGGGGGGSLARPVASRTQGPGEGIVEELALPEQTLLHEMVAIDRHDKIARCLAKGTSVNAPDCMGETPLFWAQSEEAVDLLVRSGADIHWRSWLCGCSAFFKFACQGKHRPLMALSRHLRKAGRLDEYVNDAASLTRRSPLHAAAGNGFVETVRELMALGADPSMEDAGGKTALDLARRRGFAEVAALLA